jgi:hypothetical protein
MALGSKVKALGTPTITAIDADPIFARENGLLVAFETAVADLDHQIELERLEDYLSDGARKLNHDALTWRRDVLRREFQESENEHATTPTETSAPPEVLAAIRIMQGDRPEKPASTAAEIEALLERRTVIQAGLMVQAEIVAELRAQRSHEVARQNRDQHREVLLQCYLAAQTLSRLLIEETAFRQAMTAGGYLAMPHAFPAPYLRVLAILGNEARFDSGLAQFRRQLEAEGIL